MSANSRRWRLLPNLDAGSAEPHGVELFVADPSSQPHRSSRLLA
jgi:hypothetical protein